MKKIRNKTNNQESTNSYRMPSISGLLPIIGVQLTNSRTGKSMEICALAQTLTIAQAAQSNAVELSEWLIDVALEHDQLIAKRNHKPRGATETRKINHIHQTKGRTYVTEDKSQDFKNQSTDHCKRTEKHKVKHKL